MVARFGIDISKWQGNFDIKKAIEKSGVQFAILKIGGADKGLYMDKCFNANYCKCEENDLPKGCYFYGKAKNLDEARKEVDYWLELMKGLKFEYPVFYDVEGTMLNNDVRTLTDIIAYVCQRLEYAGYWCGIYASQSTFTNRVNDSELARYTHWIARWSKQKPKLKYSETQMWQFGGELNYIRTNKVNGITVDQNYCYIDYPTYMKKKKLNGY